MDLIEDDCPGSEEEKRIAEVLFSLDKFSDYLTVRVGEVDSRVPGEVRAMWREVLERWEMVSRGVEKSVGGQG